MARKDEEEVTLVRLLVIVNVGADKSSDDGIFGDGDVVVIAIDPCEGEDNSHE